MPSLCLKNGEKRWRGAVMVNKIPSRKWFPDASKDSERAAAAWELEEKERLQQQADTQTPSGSWPLLRWVNESLANALAKKRAEATIKEKKTAFSMLVKALGDDFPLEAMDYDVAEEHLDTQDAERSGNAANKDRKNLSAEWKWAKRRFRKHGFPQGVNPWAEVERYAETRHPRYVPPMEDLDSVLAIAQGQDHAMLSVLLQLGARKDEVFRLVWEDIDFTRGRVRLTTRKTDTGEWREDWLPMTKECRKALMAQWERRTKEKGHVFAQEEDYNLKYAVKGQRFTSRQHYMAKICAKAKVKPFGFHAIRHLTAGALYEAGYPVSTIQKVLRHQSASTTEAYLKDHGYDVDLLGDALENALGKKQGKVIRMKTEGGEQ